MTTANGKISWTSAEKRDEFQSTRIPPEAPRDGEYSKLSKHLGANFRTNALSKDSLFVSCRQTIEHELSSILFLKGNHLAPSLIPRIFQHNTFQSLV